MADSTTTPPAPARDDDALVAKLAAEIRKPAAPTPAAAPTREELMRRFDEAGKAGAGKFAEEFATTVLVPAQMQNIRHAAQLNRRLVEKDATLGKLYGRYRDKIEQRAGELGGDAYIAEKGLDNIIRAVAAEDPAYIDELAEARLAERVAAIEAEKTKKVAEEESSKAARRPATEGVHSGTVASPAATTPTEDEAIAAIAVSDEDARLGATVFHMKPAEIRRQRYEIAQQERKYGSMGIRQLGGVPIVSLGSMRTGNGSPYPSEED